MAQQFFEDSYSGDDRGDPCPPRQGIGMLRNSKPGKSLSSVGRRTIFVSAELKQDIESNALRSIEDLLNTTSNITGDIATCIFKTLDDEGAAKVCYTKLKDRWGLADARAAKKVVERLKKYWSILVTDAHQAIREQFEEGARRLSTANGQLASASPSMRTELREVLVAELMSVVRIAINVEMLDGSSLSTLPEEVDLIASEGNAIEFNRVIRSETDVEQIFDSLSINDPLHHTAMSIRRYLSGGSIYSLAIDCARAVVALSGLSSLMGLAGLMQMVLLAREAIGEANYVILMRQIADLAAELPESEDGIVKRQVDHQLLTCCGLRFAALLNAASSLAAQIAMGESSSPTRDADLLAELVDTADACADESDAELIPLLRAEQVVATAIAHPDRCDDAKVFWSAMSQEEAAAVVQDIERLELQCQALSHAVRRSAERVYPSLIRA